VQEAVECARVYRTGRLGIHQRAPCHAVRVVGPTTRKNARSARWRSDARSHRFQRSQTILRHVGGHARNSRQHGDDDVYFTTMSLIPVIARSLGRSVGRRSQSFIAG